MWSASTSIYGRPILSIIKFTIYHVWSHLVQINETKVQKHHKSSTVNRNFSHSFQYQNTAISISLLN